MCGARDCLRCTCIRSSKYGQHRPVKGKDKDGNTHTYCVSCGKQLD